MRLFVFGFGYSSQACIDEVKDQFDWIVGTTRSPVKAEQLKSRGIKPFRFDGSTPGVEITPALAQATHILVSIAPSDTGDPVLLHHGKDIASGSPKWIGYLSTVGVYGNHDGAWLYEETTCKTCLQALGSTRLLQKRPGSTLHRRPTCRQIFRLSALRRDPP